MTKETNMIPKTIRYSTLLLLAAGLSQTGCNKSSESTTTSEGGNTSAASTTIQVQGSDTMVNVAQAWAEQYADVKSNVSVEVGGGGSGVGIAALINGTVDIANASRNMKDAEKAKAKANSGKDAIEIVVGYDALAVFVHKDFPLDEITVEQLDAIYAEGGNITKWSQLGAKVPGCDSDDIIRVSRQSNSGTYEYFREHILAKKDFRLGSMDMNGSKEVVELISNTPCAIGYSGMGYATDEVKMLKVAAKKGETAYEPSIKNVHDKTYPVARPLFMYTLGTPQGAVKDYVDWTLGPAGQKIVAESGYVPLSAVE